LFVQVSWTDVAPTARAARFDGAAGTGVSLPIAACADAGKAAWAG